MIKRNSTRLALLLALGLMAAPAQAQLAEGLVAYWPLDGNFDDNLGTYPGEAQGGDPIAFEEGKFGEAMRLNGEDQYVQISGDENVFDFTFVEGDENSGQFSVSTWFTVDAFDTSWQCLVCKGEGSGWRVHRRGGDVPPEMAFTGGTGGDGAANGVEVTLNDPPGGDNLVWHHIVAVTDGALIHNGTEGSTPEESSKRLYLDGQLIASGTNARLENRGNPMMIGNNPDSATREWEGHIDDVAVWNRALTPEEIAAIYSDGSGNSIGGLLNPGLPGDFNNDGNVDLLDFNILADNFGNKGTLAEGDADFNGRIDLRDFLKFRIAFSSQPAGAFAVPEPASLLLFGVVCVAMTLHRRRHRR